MRRRFLLPLLFLCGVSLYILAGVALAPFHADESTLIFMSRDYAYQFLQGDLARIYYDPEAPLTNETQLRLINGTINKDLIGLSWHLAGYTVDDLNTDWDWGGDWDYNVAAGHLPAEALLNVARLPSALLLTAGAWIIFALGWRFGGSWAATLATLYYALNPALLLNGRRAMMEGSLTCFSLLTVLVGVWFVDNLSQEHKSAIRRYLPALALGLSAGLTVASKHTGVVVVAAVFVAAALIVIVRAVTARAVRQALGHLASLIVAGLLALGIFYALNPAWWTTSPLTVTHTILEWRQDLLEGQTEAFGGYADFGDQVAGFVRQTLIVQPQYFEADSWADIPAISDQVARYDLSPLRGISLGGSPLGALIVGFFALAGIVILLRGSDHPGAARWVILFWAAATAIVALISPVEWQRYYLPVYPAIGLLAALALAAAIKRVLRGSE
ncbi:MAG: phospholipid carrier-dependent glycosyltransferase [Anaerolineae bacterium]|nr:phospholipid carrier-dependent glycosyltransferase [Anaerolineae bacterium]